MSRHRRLPLSPDTIVRVRTLPAWSRDHCETRGCAHRASELIEVEGTVLAQHCRAHTSGALATTLIELRQQLATQQEPPADEAIIEQATEEAAHESDD